MTIVSILIPVYNVKDFIVRCIDSVAMQTYAGPLECIVVDDCGDDGSIDLAKNYIEMYKGAVSFRIIRHNRNRGLAAARNTGVASANGEFVFHLDSDDWIEKTAIEQLVELQERTGADIVSGHALQHENSGEKVLKDPVFSTSKEMLYNSIEMNIGHVIWRRLIRRSLYVDNCIEAVEGVNVGEDYHTLPRLVFYAQKVATLDAIVYHYNCLNPYSYMSERTLSFNIKRYHSDYSSLKILQNFFCGKEPYCEKRLAEIEKVFFKKRMWSAAIINDYNACKEIAKDAGVGSYGIFYFSFAKLVYYKNIIKTWVKSLIKKEY